MHRQIVRLAVIVAVLAGPAVAADNQSIDDFPDSRGWEKFCAPFSAPTPAEVVQARSSIAQRLCKEPPNQRTMNWCAGHIRVSTEAQLGDAYTRVQNALPDQASKDRLAAAQRAWCGYREATCTFDIPPDAQGSMMPMLSAACLKGYAESRAASLAAFAECLEADTCARPATLFMMDLHPEVRPKPQAPAPR